MSASIQKNVSTSQDEPKQPMPTTLKREFLEKVIEKFIVAHPNVGHVLNMQSKKQKQAALLEIKDHGSQMLECMDPHDPYEALLIQQMLLSQEWMTHCFTNASVYIGSADPRTIELGFKLTNAGRRFMEMYAKQLELLDKRRNHPVSQLHIENGGQAIVGNVTVNKGQ